ncbi:uncharacterized protein LOC124999295 [Mugil cephalus]|uniref:uncharacterized protein LOC124999295 n=1 Tax=Mugil cephalus TaxID=48193 RepID=UPI001FB70502|nr:uncharacterized protein LOC124999295 [Mugil cephalus]
MEETPRSYQSILDTVQEQGPVLRNFHVYCTGRTNAVHHYIVQKVKDLGQTEVMSSEDCDYLLVFCPITSRVGTDISEAMDQVNQRDGYGSKPIILVVMHHTFDPEHVVAESGRHVENTNVLLTVDTLFYGDKLLNCKRNEIALDEIKKSLAPSEPNWSQPLTNGVKKYRKYVIAALCTLCLVIVIIVLALTSHRKSQDDSGMHDETGWKPDKSSSQCIHCNMHMTSMYVFSLYIVFT